VRRLLIISSWNLLPSLSWKSSIWSCFRTSTMECLHQIPNRLRTKSYHVIGLDLVVCRSSVSIRSSTYISMFPSSFSGKNNSLVFFLLSSEICLAIIPVKNEDLNNKLGQCGGYIHYLHILYCCFLVLCLCLDLNLAFHW
jgi:hypothetical protein